MCNSKPKLWKRKMERRVSSEAKESITERLSCLEGLYFPRALELATTTPPQRKAILLDLLSRDAAVFLERYGSQLTGDELQEFEVLHDDYEINWHLKQLRSKMNPTSEELRSRSLMVKNRRRAFLNKLICAGQYFSEDAMREREPYLHHEYVGKFQDISGRGMARPGERWSETLMRRCEEARLVAKIREEQQKLGVAERDWIGNERSQIEEEEEEEEEEEDDDEDEEVEEEEKEEQKKKANGVACPEEMLLNPGDGNSTALLPATGNNEGPTLSAEEKDEMMEQFTYIMHQKFLSGKDHQHLDYSQIDNDDTLDDHWLREVGHDAEDKYFDDV